MFQVHKKGFVSGSKMMGGLLPYDFFCEDDPGLNLFVFTGSSTPGERPDASTLWGFARLERFEAMRAAFNEGQQSEGWFQRVNVLTGPAHNGTPSLRFQVVVRVIKHEPSKPGTKPEYEIHTAEGDRYYTRRPDDASAWAPRIIYQAE